MLSLTKNGPIYDEKMLGGFKPLEYIKRYMEEKFNGYFCITIHNEYGVEEGIILFHNGKIVLSEYLYLSFGSIYKKEDALIRCLNALLCDCGVLEVYSLTEPQSRLIIVIHEENKLEKIINTEKELEKMFPQKFNKEYEIQELPDELKKDNSRLIEVRKKLGIGYKLEDQTKKETSIFKKLFGGK